jgi:hypothetical protein
VADREGDAVAVGVNVAMKLVPPPDKLHKLPPLAAMSAIVTPETASLKVKVMSAVSPAEGTKRCC